MRAAAGILCAAMMMTDVASAAAGQKKQDIVLRENRIVLPVVPATEEPTQSPKTSATVNPSATVKPVNTVDTAKPDSSVAPSDTLKPGSTITPPTPKPSATVTPSATPKPTATVRPTPTVKPVVTAKPGSPLLLGRQTEDIRLTVGAAGEFDLDRSQYSIASSLRYAVRVQYTSWDNPVLQVSTDGTYQALKPGKTSVRVEAYDDEWDIVFSGTYSFLVSPEMSGVSLDKTSFKMYRTAGSYDSAEMKVKIQGTEYVFDEDDEGTICSLTSSNKNMYISYSLTKNVLTLSTSDTGTTKVTFTLNGKEFTIEIKVTEVSLSKTSVLLTRGKTQQLKLKGTSEKVSWHSSRTAVASVNSHGKVKAKKQGNTIITVKIGDSKLGCVVSVTTPKKKKVIAKAIRVGKTGTYSQPKRMQKGYYDCSSLTWRAYSPYGYKFGDASYAPTAASQAQYLAGKHKLVKGGYSQKNVESLKLCPGDLMFETSKTNHNGRYKGIYHVEMFIGYEYYGLDSNGKPIVVSKWANRPDGYYGYGCGIVGRP